jgi:hypothetical protein
MKKSVLLTAAILVLGSSFGFAQGLWQVYHRVGPAMFTNAIAYGYADGQLAGANYYCGLYAGPDAGSLQPVAAGDGLPRLFSPTGNAVLWGNFDVPSPAGQTPVIQFRAWPAMFQTYEQALVADPMLPVGASAIMEAIPGNAIIEFPINAGRLWITSVPEPSVIAFLACGALLRVRKSAVAYSSPAHPRCSGSATTPL